MPTKLSQYCEGIMEAAWLAAVIVVPVFFNVWSNRIFEPDKITLLRTLSLVILAAWIVKLIDEGGPRWERLQRGDSAWKAILRVPLVLPVLALAIVYILATIFSVSPGPSVWGSYQRLQGTYTTLAYLVVFAALVANLRRQAQVDRLISTAIVASLAVCLYGMLQRFQADPVPWGGNVVSRITANMGNSIFIAAYIIMVFPLTAVRIVESFGAILSERGRLAPNLARATAYVFIGALQLIALYFSGSRGPWLGWGASLIFIGLLLSLIWRKRWLTVSGVTAALVAALFLAVLNIAGGPLESLRTSPGIGRLGQLLDAESRTGRVRTLIWEGAAELVLPHAPLEYPDGSEDPFNGIRPLIGYGPESMYVAYNPFYQPELTQVEKRNASPDRSHNETWDALVITGLLGLIVHLALFGFVFYYGLRWLGLVRTKAQRNLFLGLLIGGGLASAVILVAWKGIPYFGVGLPFGVIIGLVVYLIVVALFGRYESPRTDGEVLRALVMTGLLAVIVAHFVEISFGIAIAVTRTYFWTFSGLLLLTGYILPRDGAYGASQAGEASGEPGSQRTPEPVKKEKGPGTVAKKKRQAARAATRPAARSTPAWLQEALVGAFLLAILLATLGYNFITNASGGQTASSILGSSLASTRPGGGGSTYALITLIFITWLVGAVVLASESNLFQPVSAWGKTLAVILGVSLALGAFFWFWHSAGMAALAASRAANLDDVLAQLRQYEGLLSRYYTYLLALVFGGAACLRVETIRRSSRATTSGLVAAPLALVLALAIASYTNLRVIQADISFKLAEPFARSGAWPVAISVYQRANELAPAEDYYYLFLGRAYLENAKAITDAQERERLVQQAANDLRKAQSISPLNTDHTANLARLHSLWASFTADPEQRAQRAQASSDYFARAVVLSPNNARIWDEWALLYLNTLQQPDEAYQRLQQALGIDPYYDWTYALLGDYYGRSVQEFSAGQGVEKQSALKLAVEHYQKALELASPSDVQMKYGYALALGGVETQRDQPENAIEAYELAIQLNPNSAEKWRVEETIARLYAQSGDRDNARVYAERALLAAPDDQRERLQTLVAQLRNQP